MYVSRLALLEAVRRASSRVKISNPILFSQEKHRFSKKERLTSAHIMLESIFKLLGAAFLVIYIYQSVVGLLTETIWINLWNILSSCY